MLTPDILQTLQTYAERLVRPVTFVLQTGEHDKREELKGFLGQLVSVSPQLSLVEADAGLRSPVSFALQADGADTGIVFSGIPGGHEFNSLVLAMLQAGGSEIRLDDGLKAMVAAVDERIHFEVFISLSCHNCPEVVQALNQFALLNERISTEMIDGGLFRELVAERDIQGVPSVYANGELFANGKVDAARLIDRIIERNPSIAKTAVGEALPLQDVTVVGGGPAGVSAAIYAARKGLKVTLVADRLGGQVKDTMGIENFISVPATTGPELSAALAEHLGQYEVTTREHLRVTGIEPGKVKTLTLSSGERIESRSVILATGARWRELGVPGEKEYLGSGVAYCPHCDGPFFKGRDVAVIGGGNSGIEAALDLAGIVKSVTVLEFAQSLKADQVLVDQAERRDNIRIITGAATSRITASNGKVDGLEYVDRASGEEHRVELAGVFVQIGLVPNSQQLAGVVDLTRHGEVIIDDKCRTSAEGIFACGDLTTVPYKQIVIAMGEGSKASLAAFEYLLMTPAEDEPRQAA